MQNKSAEVAFFDAHATAQEYDVFAPESSRRLVESCLRLAGFASDDLIADLGCGSGVFTELARETHRRCFGMDISQGLLLAGRSMRSDLGLLAGDIEALPMESASLDGVILSGVIHHFPDPSRCAAEVFRVLKPSGRFVAFDPNQLNPFMWLFRDKRSPLYNSTGVTQNEGPILAGRVVGVFSRAGFRARAEYLSGLHYRYVASAALRLAVPAYNMIDDLLARVPAFRPFSAFVLTVGQKP